MHKKPTLSHTMISPISGGRIAILLVGFLFLPDAVALSTLGRREAIRAVILASTTTMIPPRSIADTTPLSIDDTVAAIPYELRDRHGNRDALIREDYWYMMGKTPPRLMGEGMMKTDNPQWNTFGTCESSGGTNSCTYVSIKQQRIPAYSKYAFLIQLGAKDFRRLGTALAAADWDMAEMLLSPATSVPPPAIDALLKMILFASSMLTSPNYSGPNRELLVARFYVNECGFATKEIAAAVEARDLDRARAAWDFGRDSWNSYLTIVNRQITPKVGDKLEFI